MKTIGRYQIVGELGRGAMGVVYQATDPAIGRSVAIKTIRIRDINDSAQRQKLRDRLFREARSAGVLSHPNIVTIYDIDEADGIAWIAMAHVKGPTLESLLGDPRPLSPTHALHILRQVAAALDYAHSRSVIHRDIKPANIMVDEDAVVKIADFGIARVNSANATETRTVVGTPNYMSPEQVQGQPVDGKSDQFSLAVVVYEILTGELPFQGENLSQIVHKIVWEDPLWPSRLNPTLTPGIDLVLRRALARKPSDRFSSCANFIAALEMACGQAPGWRPVVGTGPAPAQTTASATSAAAPTRQQASLFWPVFAVVLVMLAIAGAVAWEGGLIPASALTGARDAVQDAVKDAFQNGDRRPVPAPAPQSAAQSAARSAPPTPDAQPAPVPSDLQDVAVTTNPAGAKITLDDQPDLSCQSPCTLHAAPGAHHLAVSADGYASASVEIEVAVAPLEVPVITLRQAP